MRFGFAWVVGLIASLALAVPSMAAPVDYRREIKPIFIERCVQCHGASQQKHGLRLDTAASARRGGEHGPAVVPGNSRGSLLVQVIRGTHSELARMPYKKPPLEAAEIDRVAAWIDQGAKAPADEPAEQAIHWSFRAPVRPPVPVLKRAVARPLSDNPRARSRPAPAPVTIRPENPIDAFILERLDREGLRPSPEADSVTLLRRVSLDLIGLPPRPEEVDAFLAEVRQDPRAAYEHAVDRLLASPHYGERWGRHWLDVARYADSNGYSIDAPRSLWKYRDWVIRAFNQDMPFDRFTRWQLAGDLVRTNDVSELPPGTSSFDPLVASGFHRNTQINQEGGIDPEQFRVESVMDRVNTTATAWLGLTLGCAQCHDHKFDPLSQREYYQFYAFFNSTVEDGHGRASPEGTFEFPGENESAESRQHELMEAEGELERYLNTRGHEVAEWEKQLSDDARSKLKADLRRVLAVAPAERTLGQRRQIYAAYRADDNEFKQRNAKVTRLEKAAAKPISTLVMREATYRRTNHVFIKGDFTRPGAEVMPGVPAILPPIDGSASGDESSRIATRLDLARWLVGDRNPLTARVLVNRIWQEYFGRGLVETENDFGTQGSAPSHPALLDWLACELMHPTVLGGSSGSAGGRGGGAAPAAPWTLKALHRLIVMSATYRQSSKARPELALVDPNNRLLSRQNRLRLDAEIVRDVALSASGLLNETIGGPSVHPPQPDGVMNLGQSRREWKADQGPDRYRRGMYTFFWRATPYPSLMVFDAADGISACTRRLRSNTPLQALTLLNDEAFHECAQALASRIIRASSSGGSGPTLDDGARLDLAFRICLARRPESGERDRLKQLLAREQARVGEMEAWTTMARVLLNVDEMITRE